MRTFDWSSMGSRLIPYVRGQDVICIYVITDTASKPYNPSLECPFWSLMPMARNSHQDAGCLAIPVPPKIMGYSSLIWRAFQRRTKRVPIRRAYIPRCQILCAMLTLSYADPLDSLWKAASTSKELPLSLGIWLNSGSHKSQILAPPPCYLSPIPVPTAGTRPSGDFKISHPQQNAQMHHQQLTTLNVLSRADPFMQSFGADARHRLRLLLLRHPFTNVQKGFTGSLRPKLAPNFCLESLAGDAQVGGRLLSMHRAHLDATDRLVGPKG